MMCFVPSSGVSLLVFWSGAWDVASPSNLLASAAFMSEVEVGSLGSARPGLMISSAFQRSARLEPKRAEEAG